jgi:hydrogenase nickel incorporation protein HypB
MLKKIRLIKNVFSENDRIAAEIRKKLDEAGLFMINVLGSPGTGKTSLITSLVRALRPISCAVIEGDCESDIDTVNLKKKGIKAYQINTLGGCHLDSPMIDKVMRTAWFRSEVLRPLTRIKPWTMGRCRGFLLIENIGNLICPAEFDLGEHFRLLVSSTTEGSDKPYKYPIMFEKADVVAINKSDLAKQTGFKHRFFLQGVRRMNRTAQVHPVSAVTGQGVKELAWILRGAAGFDTKDH